MQKRHENICSRKKEVWREMKDAGGKEACVRRGRSESERFFRGCESERKIT